MISRRNFLKNTALGIAGGALSLAAFEIVDPKKLMAMEAADNSKLRWVFLVSQRNKDDHSLLAVCCAEVSSFPSVTRGGR